MSFAALLLVSALVLIETLWNVKEDSTKEFANAASINRNIVECKARISRYRCLCSGVLIETLWNVKEYLTFFKIMVTFVLIETLWNVKMSEIGKTVFLTRINRNIVECKVF